MKKVLIMIYLSVLISSCNAEDRKENRKEIKKEVQIEKIENKYESKKSNNNKKIAYIEIEPVEIKISDSEINEINNEKRYNPVKVYDAEIKFLSKIDSRISNIKNGICYMIIDGEKRICGRIENGKKEGKWEFWNSKGEKIAELNYKDGKLDGMCKIKDDMIYYMSYKNGKKDGRYNYFGEDGSEEEGLYEDGEKIGEWSGYNNAGEIPEEMIYINGKELEYKILPVD